MGWWAPLINPLFEFITQEQENSPSDGHVCGVYLCASPQTSFLCQDKQVSIIETIKAFNCINEWSLKTFSW